MRRGAIVLARGSTRLTEKPRPYVVVQAQATLARARTITACPITTQQTGATRFRVPIAADALNNLAQDSEVAAEAITTFFAQQISETIGAVEPWQLDDIDSALRNHLAL